MIYLEAKIGGSDLQISRDKLKVMVDERASLPDMMAERCHFQLLKPIRVSFCGENWPLGNVVRVLENTDLLL